MSTTYLTRILVGLFIAIPCVAQPTITFRDCSIVARSARGDAITKQYRCGNQLVSLTGSRGPAEATAGAWAGAQHIKEFGEWWFGELDDFGKVAGSVLSYDRCKSEFGGRSNFDGYMSLEVKLTCASTIIVLVGKWGEEIQGNWSYNLHLGEVHMEPGWIDDPKDYITRATFQRWCPTDFGFRLCGWVDEPKVDHGRPPAMRRK